MGDTVFESWTATDRGMSLYHRLPLEMRYYLLRAVSFPVTPIHDHIRNVRSRDSTACLHIEDLSLSFGQLHRWSKQLVEVLLQLKG